MTSIYGVPEYCSKIYNGSKVNLHLYIQNLTYSNLIYQESLQTLGGLMPAVGNAYVIPSQTCCTICNLTSEKYQTCAVEGCIKLLVDESLETPLFLYIKYKVPENGTNKVAVRLSTNQLPNTTYDFFDALSYSSTDTDTSWLNGYTVTATIKPGNVTEFELVLEVKQ